MCRCLRHLLFNALGPPPTSQGAVICCTSSAFVLPMDFISVHTAQQLSVVLLVRPESKGVKTTPVLDCFEKNTSTHSTLNQAIWPPMTGGLVNRNLSGRRGLTYSCSLRSNTWACNLRAGPYICQNLRHRIGQDLQMLRRVAVVEEGQNFQGNFTAHHLPDSLNLNSKIVGC